MVLVDSSVVIDFLKNAENAQTIKLDNLINKNIPFGINPNIYQEVLQGVATEKEFKLVKEYLDSQRFYYLKHGNESYATAAMMYFKCRKKGVTVSSTIDLIIALTAIENSLFLLHNDNDYNKIQSVFPDLIFY